MISLVVQDQDEKNVSHLFYFFRQHHSVLLRVMGIRALYISSAHLEALIREKDKSVVDRKSAKKLSSTGTQTSPLAGKDNWAEIL